MLPPVSLSLQWHGPFQAIDAFDPGAQLAAQYDWPGVYLQLTRGPNSIAASYVGKHSLSVAARQREHFEALAGGQYHLYDRSGTRSFTARSPIPGNFFDLLEEHVNLTEIYFGEIVQAPMTPARWVDSTESLLQRSPTWRANGGDILNHRAEAPGYQMHYSFEITHLGSHKMLQLFGSKTIWDRKLKAVS